MKNLQISTDVFNVVNAGGNIADLELSYELSKELKNNHALLAGVLARYLTAEQMQEVIAYSKENPS